MKHVIFVDHQELLELAKKQLSKDYPAGFELVIVPSEDIQKEEPKPMPWYPDDSGEWIECDRIRPDDLFEDTVIDVLYDSERQVLDWFSQPDKVNSWNWNKVVAYKVVEKVD